MGLTQLEIPGAQLNLNEMRDVSGEMNDAGRIPCRIIMVDPTIRARIGRISDT